MPNMHLVFSLHGISDIGYDSSSEELYVYMLNGAKWKFLGVPASVWDPYFKVIASKSVDDFLALEVRGKYKVVSVS